MPDLAAAIAARPPEPSPARRRRTPRGSLAVVAVAATARGRPATLRAGAGPTAAEPGGRRRHVRARHDDRHRPRRGRGRRRPVAARADGRLPQRLVAATPRCPTPTSRTRPSGSWSTTCRRDVELLGRTSARRSGQRPRPRRGQPRGHRRHRDVQCRSATPPARSGSTACWSPRTVMVNVIEQVDGSDPRAGRAAPGVDRRARPRPSRRRPGSTSPTRWSLRQPRSIRRVPREPLSDPRPRAVAVVERDGKVLVIRRHLDGRDYAVLPGGGIEDGESPADAALRELREECTLEGTLGGLLLEGGPRRTAGVLLPGHRRRGRAGARRRGGRGAGRDQPVPPDVGESQGPRADGPAARGARRAGRGVAVAADRPTRPDGRRRLGGRRSTCGSRTSTTSRSSAARRQDRTARFRRGHLGWYDRDDQDRVGVRRLGWATGPSGSRWCAGSRATAG